MNSRVLVACAMVIKGEQKGYTCLKGLLSDNINSQTIETLYLTLTKDFSKLPKGFNVFRLFH